MILTHPRAKRTAKVAVETELTSKGLQQHPFLIMKIIQLSDSQLTRHCNMLVGR